MRSLVLIALFAVLLPLALADECDRYLSDCGNCLKSPGCGWCAVGGFKFCVDKNSGFCREDEWATTCDATHHKVQSRISGDAPECAALDAVKPCKSLSMLDCNARISTDCVACVLTASQATCEDFVSTVYGTSAPPPAEFGSGQRWARAGLVGLPATYYDYYDYYDYSTETPRDIPTTAPPTTVPVTTVPDTTVPDTTVPTTTVPDTTVPDTTVPDTTVPTTTVPTTTVPATTVPVTTTPAPPRTTAPTTQAPVAYCSARFTGDSGANFIKAFLESLIKISISADNVNNPDDINCRADIADLIGNEFNLWMTVEITKLGGENDEWHLSKIINFNVFNLDKNVAHKRQGDGIDDFATTFAIANFTENVVRKFAALFENGGAGLYGPLKGKITSISVTAATDSTGKRKKSDINGGELAAVIAVVSVFICMICVGTGYLLFRRSQLGKAPFAAAQASGPQR